MLRSLAAFQVYLLLGALALAHADVECHSGSCDSSTSDHISLIQGILEPDLVAKLLRTDEEIGGVAKKEATANTTTTTTQGFAVKGQKVKLNAAGDLSAFIAAIKFDLALFLLFFIAFLILQKWYPTMYAWRWFDGDGDKFSEEKLRGDGPEAQGYFTWMKKAWITPVLMSDRERMQANSTVPLPPSIEETCGLDAAMLLKFNDLALELLVAIGIPACIIGIPVYAYAGGGMAKEDRLSWAGIGNVVYNNTHLTDEPMERADADKLPDVQWIFWVVAGTVWLVVVGVMMRMKKYQSVFIESRMKWLLRMPEPRSTTVLVQGIPEGFTTNDKLKERFEDMFGKNSVKAAFVIAKTGRLSRNQATYKATKDYLSQLKDAIESMKSDAEGADQTEMLKAKEEEIEAKEAELQSLKQTIEEEQLAIKNDPEQSSTNGFVTFNERTDAERALGVRLAESDDIWVLETPPAPADVRYSDFEYSDEVATTSQYLGYAAIAGLLFAFMPIVIGISNLSKTIEATPWIHNIVKATGFESTVQGVLATVGLTIMMSMLPTFLVWIFQLFYTLKADRWAQIQIQIYYFWFLILFVLLTTSVGTNLQKTLTTLAQKPFKIFSLLADMMPVTTHFYLNYCVFAPVTHAMNLTRYIQLIKFFIFRKVVDPADARRLAEPEDQDYYGVGSRSARFALMLLIGLVFGTICPLMNVVCLFNFVACRFIYGYLIPYHEMRKSDLGGAHWCVQLHHMQLGILIYVIMMTGILLQRAQSYGPGIISATSFLWWFIVYRRFHKSMHWEKLPYVTMVKAAKGEDYKPTKEDVMYEQPELAWKASKL